MKDYRFRVWQKTDFKLNNQGPCLPCFGHCQEPLVLLVAPHVWQLCSLTEPLTAGPIVYSFQQHIYTLSI